MKRWILVLSAVLGVGGLLGSLRPGFEDLEAESGKVPADFMAGSQIWIEGNSPCGATPSKWKTLSAQSD